MEKTEEEFPAVNVLPSKKVVPTQYQAAPPKCRSSRKSKTRRIAHLRFLLSPFPPIFPFHTYKSLESTKEQHLLAFLSAAQAKSTITAKNKNP